MAVYTTRSSHTSTVQSSQSRMTVMESQRALYTDEEKEDEYLRSTEFLPEKFRLGQLSRGSQVTGREDWHSGAVGARMVAAGA
jgi:hypothetical protein